MDSPWSYTRPKSPPPRSRSPSLPSWYHRILEYPDYTVSYEDFDEDISELSESESEPKHGEFCGCGCIPYEVGSECGSGSDQEGFVYDEIDSQSESDSIGFGVGCSDGDSSDDERDETRSRAGREYDYYYELKEQREERKRQIKQEIRDGEPTQKEVDRQYELRFERDVKKVYHRVRHQRGRRKNLFLRGKRSELGPMDQLQYAYLGHTPQSMSKYVDFDDYPEILFGGAPKSYRPPPDQESRVGGHVYMFEEGVSHFWGPVPPKRTGLKKFTCEDEQQYKATFQFLDNSHLMMKATRELVFAGYPRKMPPDASKTFVFYGIEER
ncbi:hypothetical protein LCI18_003319 [Fusarium solani-melongenae]|uniref:Uncharacterized protein n=1 Tax=Fusarium solani subsp. cucurbitae TaxID=2747967 RepID=A0ACD3YTU8_FUSSC|nr:hypothetical protein LCI18_003319 [Fusarium solani-melongenae]